MPRQIRRPARSWALVTVFFAALGLSCPSVREARVSGARAPAPADASAAWWLEPVNPYPWRYGAPPPGLVVARRAFEPGERIAFRFAATPALRDGRPQRWRIELTLVDLDGAPRTASGGASVADMEVGRGRVAGDIVLAVPNVADGEYLLVARVTTTGGGPVAAPAPTVRSELVFVSGEHRQLHRRAVTALESARAAKLDEIGRAISLPSLEMMVEDAEIVWNDFVDAARDGSFVRAQLETAARWADRLAAGDDPYRKETGVLIKANRSLVDNTLQPYALRVPRDYRADRQWPLVVDLHGAYANHRVDMRRIFGRSNRPGEDDHEATRNELALPETDMLVLAVFGRGEFAGYTGLGEEDVLDAIAAVERAYRVDPDRVYLTGYSMGGEGAWQIGLHYPDRFAAIAPICASSDPGRLVPHGRDDWDMSLIALGTPRTIAENALNLRVFVYHGDRDPVVPVTDSRAMVDRYRALGWLGKNVTYHELPGIDHAAWVPAHRDARLIAKMASVRRDRFPRRVVYRTISPRYRDAYWLRVDAVERALTVAEIRGEQDGRRFDVRTTNVRGLSLRLDRSPRPDSAQGLNPAAGQTIEVHVDGAPVYAGPAAATLSFARDGAAWRLVSTPVSWQTPDHAQPGFFSKSLPRSRSHIYVYGTRGGPEVNSAAKRLAEALADWGPGVKARFAVKADHEVSEADIRTRDLVLVGGARTNTIVAKMAAHLPVADRDDALIAGKTRITAPDRAYRLIAPNPLERDRYVLVLGADTARGLGHLSRFAAPNQDHWAPEPNYDYVLFDGDGKVAVAGIFRDRWEVGR